MRRPEPLHPAAFLVDQHGRLPANNIAERMSEFLYLARRTHVSLENDQAPRPGLAEKGALVGGYRINPAKPVMKARAVIGAD